MVKVITAEELSNLDNNGSILVDFFADWCGPCQQLGPILDEVSNEVDTPIYKINVDDPASKKLAMKNKVMSIPTMVMFKNGESVATTGFLGKEDLIKFINENK
ncbi:MAG: thioredoxin family protein [Bacilli bacterium]